jgi:chemotaxis protein MotB
MARQSNQTHIVEEEESYFVSMTDLMVGVIFVFVILLMAFAMSYREQEVKTTKEFEKFEVVREARTQLLKDIQQTLKNHGIEVTIDPERGAVMLPEDVLFPSGSAQISGKGRSSLKVLATELMALLPCHAVPPSLDARCATRETSASIETVFVEGHTDNVPVSRNSEYRDNWSLSAARSIETYQELIRQQPELDELTNAVPQKLFSVSGYGERRPIDTNESETGKSRNRRIELRILMAQPSRDSQEL